MKKYELLTILKANLDTDEIDKVIEKMDSDLAELGGKVESRDKMGRKKLAYDIQKSRDGFFVNTILSMPEEKVADFRRALKLNDNVLRVMLLDVTEKASV
ncbi:30S ribosomal protein S6 [bacterium]|nr:30S ribosomal protein S6 [bacterium]